MSIELEQVILGTAFLEKDVYEKCLEGEVFDFFFTESIHQEIFKAFADLHSKQRSITVFTVLPYIEKNKFFLNQDFTPQCYLAELVGGAVGISVLKDFIDTLADNYKKNKYLLFIAQCQSLIKQNIPIQQIIQTTEANLSELQSLAGGSASEKIVSLKDSFEAVISDIDACQKGDIVGAGLSTGIKSLDNVISGLKKSDLVIIAGRPAMGKTAFATNIGFNLASKENVPVGIFSLEMSHQQLSSRIISSLSNIELQKLYSGYLTDSQVETVVACTEIEKNAPMHIDDRGGQDISSIVSTAKFMHKKHGVEIIIIDYLQLIKANGLEANKVAEVTYITKALKALAKDLNIPIIALSQLSRGVESREEKRPVMADLRDSGSIEQDADIVMMVYRDEYYVNQQKPQEGTTKFFEWETRMMEAKGKAEIIVAKNRHGGTGTVPVNFDGRFTRFHE